MFAGQRCRAIDSVKLLCAAFAGANPAVRAMPRLENVAPMTTMLPPLGFSLVECPASWSATGRECLRERNSRESTGRSPRWCPMCLFRRCTRECVPVPCRVVSRRTFAPPIPHRSRHSCRRVHRRDLLPAVYSSRLFARGVPRQIPPSKSDVRAPLRSLDLLQPLRILFPSS